MRILAPVVALLALLSACGGTPGPASDAAPTRAVAPSATPTRTPTATPADPAGPPTVPPFPRHRRDQSQESTTQGLVLTDVRVARHAAYDRVVLELAGSGTPGWQARYVDRARLDGSGRRVRLGGRSVLEVFASGTTAPAADYYSGPRRLRPDRGGPVSEVYVAGTFEGYTQVLLGVSGSPAPFRVFTLASPARLVVDVARRPVSPAGRG